jgi:hypothetical protein
VALSILPIEQSTLAYGSADGGVVVHTENSRLNDYMQAAGQKMNLKVSIVLLFLLLRSPELTLDIIKGHLGGSENCVDKKMIFGPTDIGTLADPRCAQRERVADVLFAYLPSSLLSQRATLDWYGHVDDATLVHATLHALSHL